MDARISLNICLTQALKFNKFSVGKLIDQEQLENLKKLENLFKIYKKEIQVNIKVKL